MMRRRRGFNLSDWALHHRSLVWFLLIVSMVAGLISYRALGREEDPNFTIKVMVISAAMPGATIAETLDQVTDRIETKLEELDELDFTRSVTMPGQAIVYVELLPTVRGACCDQPSERSMSRTCWATAPVPDSASALAAERICTMAWRTSGRRKNCSVPRSRKPMPASASAVSKAWACPLVR